MTTTITRKGRYTVLDLAKKIVSTHNYLEEAIESASNAPAGVTYSIVPPTTTLIRKCASTPPVEPPPVEPPPIEPPPVDPEVTLNLDLSHVDTGSEQFATFLAYARAQVKAPVGGWDWGFCAAFAVHAYRLSGDADLRDLAVSVVDKQVADAEAEIARGSAPAIAGDSYINSGAMLADVALVLAYCAPSASQSARWAAYAEQAVWNIWNPTKAAWGGKSMAWSGWGTDDPGNNYYYHFSKATVYWALASNSATWRARVTDSLLPTLSAYFAGMPAGGSREGTNYGLSHREVFELLQVWQDSGGSVPASLLNLAAADVDYWIHATIPSRDAVAPIGDQTRESYPALMAYHYELVARAAQLTGDADVQRKAGHWLSTAKLEYTPNWGYWTLCLPVAPGGADPAQTHYEASEAGAYFVRSGWGTTDTWFAVVAGLIDQSHQQAEQGGFAFADGQGFLAVAPNVYSHSGLRDTFSQSDPRDGTGHNVLRFADGGRPIPQKSGTQASVSVSQGAGGSTTVNIDLAPVYADARVAHYTRSLDYAGKALTVTDTFTVSSGVVAVAGIGTGTVRPTINGSVVTAGRLKLTVLKGGTPTIEASPNGSDAGTASYRVDVPAVGGIAQVMLDVA